MASAARDEADLRTAPASPCLTCPDVRLVPCDDGRTSYYCEKRFIYVRPSRQNKALPRPCPYRVNRKRGRQLGEDNGDLIDSEGNVTAVCVWCGRRRAKKDMLYLSTSKRRLYCHLKCLTEKLNTLVYDRNGDIMDDERI